ncbi:uncharacterized protein LOC106073284 [Biomphalaria glabrata]|uniref:Uncharacterized protein LOC106073284 n=1 Tax=Biomphalaria glabrata TaxID=6526 RepID=A0A9W2YCK3_BIOGL|nr:uncharacterized protein LOC106073284 [Biomphalaria glabrata]
MPILNMDTGHCTCWSRRRKTPLTFSSVYFLVFILSKICSESLALFKPNVSYLSTLPSHVDNENAKTMFERWSNTSDKTSDKTEQLKLYKSQLELRQPVDFEFDTPQLLSTTLDSNYVPVKARKSSDVLASSFKKRPWFHSWSGRKRNIVPTFSSTGDEAAQYLRFIGSKNPHRNTKIWNKLTAVNQESSEDNKISQMGKQGDALDSKHVLEKSSVDDDQNMQTKPQHTIKISKWDNTNKIADDDTIRLQSNSLKYRKGKVSNSRLRRSRQLTPGYEDFSVNLPPSSDYLSEAELTQTWIRNTCLLLESSSFRLLANKYGKKCFLQPYKRFIIARHRPDRLISPAVNVFYRTEQDNDLGNDKLANANINTNQPFQIFSTVSLGDDLNAHHGFQLIDKDKDLSISDRFELNIHDIRDQRIFNFDPTLDQSGNVRQTAYVQDCIEILSDPDCKDVIREVENIVFQRKVSIPLEELSKNIQFSEMLNKEQSNDIINLNSDRPNIGHKTTEGISLEASDKTGPEDSSLKELDNKLTEGKNTMITDFLTVPEDDDSNLKSTHLLSTKQTLRDYVTNSDTFPVLQWNENSHETSDNRATDLDAKSSEQLQRYSSSSVQDDLNDLQPFLQAYANLLATKSARYSNPLSTDFTDVSALHDIDQEGSSQQSLGHIPSNIQLLKSSPENVKAQKEINNADVSNMLYLNSYPVDDGSLKGKLHGLRKLDFDNNIQRSSMDSDLVDLIDKRPSFHSWSGKRNLQASERKIPKRPSFHSWSGKRNEGLPTSEIEISKRPSFHSWSGKRNVGMLSKRPSFHSWSGKRNDDMLSKRPSFHSWSGKRNLPTSEIDISKRPSFHSWSGKRDEHVNGIRKRASFHSWSGKRNAFQSTLSKIPSFHSWSGKRNIDLMSKRPSFHSWSGKRDVDMLSKRPSFHSWSGKRDVDILSKRPSFHSWSGKRDVDMLSKRPSFHSWSGKRNIDLMSKRPSFHSWSGKRDVDILSKRPSFHSWSGKRDVDLLTKRPSFHSWSGKRDVDQNLISKSPSLQLWSDQNLISKRPSLHSWSGK